MQLHQPLAVAILNPTLYPPDKSGLRNYVINLPRSSNHKEMSRGW